VSTVKQRLVVKVVSAVAAGALLAIGAGAAASAAPVTLPKVDPSQKGELLIHKFETPATPAGLPNDGRELSASQLSGLTPLPGVGFTVERLSDYDLTTNAGWNAIKGLTPADVTASTPVDSVATVSTDGNGTADFTNLPLGIYLVTESTPPANSTVVAPFLVTVPTTDPVTKSSWLYTVNVYPKNDITTASKTVDDAATRTIGDAVKYTITSDIPNAPTIDAFRIVDPINKALTWDNASQAPAVKLSDGTTVPSNDYTVTYPVNDGTLADATTYPNDLVIDFNAGGRTFLAAHNTLQLVVTFSPTINAVGDDIDNKAYVYPNAASLDILPGAPGGPTPSDDPVVKVGNFTVEKTDASDGHTLKGAVFAVYPTKDDAIARTNAIMTSAATADDGLAAFTGLRYSRWADGGAVTPSDAGYQSYWVMETVAPSGYQLMAQPIEFTVDSQSTAVQLTIPDTLANSLPFTGSEIGAGLFYGAGAIVLAGAILLFVRSRRRANAVASAE
jgi:fimbrial isopeptide formation D2 family protein